MMITFDLQTMIVLAVALLAIAIILQAPWKILTAFESREWPTAPGVILSARIQETADAEDFMFNAAVSYRFHAGGKEVVGHCACFGDSNASTSRFLARRVAGRYRVGQPVTVHYNPTKPEQCVLEPGLNAYLALEMFVGCLALAIAVFALRAGA